MTEYKQPPQPIYSLGSSRPIGYIRSDGSYDYTTPKPKVSVIVATFGYDEPGWIDTYDGEGYWQDTDEDWLEDHPWEVLAQKAVKSINTNRDDHRVEVIRVYGETLAKARNEGASRARGEWLIFLDADDELDENYIANMYAAAVYLKGDIFKPSTLGMYDNGEVDKTPVLIPKRNLLRANHIVIGAMVRKTMFEAAGGFMELPALEDWDLWLRCVLMHDAKVVEVPTAIYRVRVRDNSRNQDTKAHNTAYRDIVGWSRPIARSRGISEL